MVFAWAVSDARQNNNKNDKKLKFFLRCEGMKMNIVQILACKVPKIERIIEKMKKDGKVLGKIIFKWKMYFLETKGKGAVEITLF